MDVFFVVCKTYCPSAPCSMPALMQSRESCQHFDCVKLRVGRTAVDTTWWFIVQCFVVQSYITFIFDSTIIYSRKV